MIEDDKSQLILIGDGSPLSLAQIRAMIVDANPQVIVVDGGKPPSISEMPVEQKRPVVLIAVIGRPSLASMIGALVAKNPDAFLEDQAIEAFLNPLVEIQNVHLLKPHRGERKLWQKKPKKVLGKKQSPKLSRSLKNFRRR